MNLFRLGTICLGVVSALACQPTESTKAPFNHMATIDMEANGILPVHFDIQEGDQGLAMAIVNGDDRMDLSIQYDSTTEEIFVQLPFDGTLYLWKNPYGGYRGQYVRASKSLDQDIEILPTQSAQRFASDVVVNDAIRARVKSTYAVHIERYGDCVVELRWNEDSTLAGSVLTQTGDLRYMVGNWIGDGQFKLSTFDGVFAYVLDVQVHGDSIQGVLRAGSQNQYALSGVADDHAQLLDPTSITTARPDANWDLNFPIYDSGALQSIDPRQHQVTIIQIMGSWCPNCLDEGRAFQEFYETYGNQGLGIYALTFERSEDRIEALPAMSRMLEHTGTTYPVLFAGKAYRGAAEDALPIENFISYPTYIVLDARGQVLEIHAGFSGPGTSKYQTWYDALDALIQGQIAS